MTDQTGGDQPQKTVAELLAQHGAQVDGGNRRRRRRAAEDDAVTQVASLARSSEIVLPGPETRAPRAMS
ncbi:hypothetical protein AB0M71_41495, partial [Amycolatopsis sp. NPDC051114]